MLRVPFILFNSMAIFWISCGPDKKAFDNPLDPDCKTKEKVDCNGDTSDPTYGGSTGTGGPGSPSNTVTTSSTGSVPTGSIYNFANSFSVTPSGCTAVTKVKTFEHESGLMIFVGANCGERTHVYAYKANFAGVAETLPRLLTGSCTSGSTGVKYFDVDKGNNAYMLAYVCEPGSGSTTTYAAAVDSNGIAGTSRSIETGQSKEYRVAWNSSAGTYALVRAGLFQRLSEDTSAVGGPVTIPNSSIESIAIFSGNWHIYHHTDYGFSYFSLLGEQGTLICASSGLESGSTFMPLTETVAIEVRNYYSYGVNRRTVLASACQFDSRDLSKDAEFTNQPKSITYADTYGSIAISSDIGALLYQTGSSLILVTVPITGLFKIYAESSIVGFTKLTDATVRVINNRPYVSFAKDGAGYVSYSNETLP